MRCLLLLAFFAASAASAQIPDGLAGRWSGAAIYAGGTPRIFDLEFSLDENDSLSTVLTLPYNGFDRFSFDFAYAPSSPADGILTSDLFGDEMRLLVDLGEGNLRGTVVSEGDTTATVYLQRVIDYELPTFSREEVSFIAGRDTLAGHLILPDAPGPYPVAVLVPGRGFGNSRGAMGSWGTLLARNGIAALAFDARGTGQSTGADSLTTGAERVEDLDAALDFLQAHSAVRADQVGVLSSSAGGWVTPLAIADRDDVAFWISLVGPAESLADQQGHVTTELMRRSGRSFTEAEYEAAFAFQSGLVRLSNEGAPWSALVPLVAEARTQSWAEFADLPDGLDNSELTYYRRRTTFDPTEALRRIRVPTLAIYGTEDFVVPPSINVPKLEASAAAAGNDDLTVLVFDGAEHSLGRPGGVVGEGTWPERYTRLWTRPPELYTTVVEWLQARVDESE